MPALFATLISLILFSCGEVPVDPEGSLAISHEIEYKEDDFLGATERSLLVSTCNALESKERFFERNYVNRGRPLMFRLRKHGCDGAVYSDTNFSSEVTSTSRGIELETVRSGGFKDIITTRSKEISEFCKFSSSTENLHRAEKYGNNATWLHILKSGVGSCQGDDNSVCLVFSSGSKIADSSKYTINDLEILKVGLNSRLNSYGVVLGREYYSNKFCENKNRVDGSSQESLSFN